MANNINIAEEVAQMSQEQQDKIIKVGKIATAIELIVAIPWFIGTLLGLWVIIDPPASISLANYDTLLLGFTTWLVVGALYIFGVFVFVKIKFPFYSDAKWKYINNMRKGK